MPGITIFKGDYIRNQGTLGRREVSDDDTFLSYALNSVLHDNRYTKEKLLKEESFLVACTRYPGYPISVYEDENFWVCIEGKIYGQDYSKIKKEINILLSEVFFTYKYREIGNNAVDRWLSKADGEFIIFALNKNNREFVVINDILGRLPLYYYSDDTRLIISRELALIAHLVYHDNIEKRFILDRMAIAQYLLFGYTLEKRTLFNDVYRTQPGTLTRISNDNLCKVNNNSNTKIGLRIENLFTFNFEQKEHAYESLGENGSRLISLFSEACKDRADPSGNNIISLSGGFDSRIVAACFYRNKIPCRAITYSEPGWKPLLGNKSESEIAKTISDEFGFSWKDYGPIQSRAKDFLALLKAKMGSVHLGYSFMLPLLEVLNKESACNPIFFTGYGGGRVLVNLLLSERNISIDELIHSTIHRESFLSLSDVSKLVQISEEEILEELKRIFRLYPENDLAQKYVHFIIYGGSFKAIFEVEDRDRFYFWGVSPFYSIPLFRYVMNCSDDNKSSRALHREILTSLSPSAAAVDNSDYGCSIISYKFKVIIPILKSLIFRYPFLKRIAARIIRDKNRTVLDHRMISCLREQMVNCKSLTEYFSSAKLSDMANNPAKYGLHGIYHLFTIMSLIEVVYSNKSSIEKYYD